jgi:hypothetical protein|tara:strand:- start:363 stop:536 length:174 start_codon:yes stop_codon:yes gene_type:complete
MTRRYKPATAIIIVTYECYLEPEDVKALDNGKDITEIDGWDDNRKKVEIQTMEYGEH